MSSEVQVDSIEIRIATADDGPRIRDFLATSFFRDEPLNKCRDLSVNGKPFVHNPSELSEEEMEKGVSLVALHDGKLVGVCLNTLEERQQEHGQPPKEVEENKNFGKIMRFLRFVVGESRVFDRFPDANRAMDVCMLSVDSGYRGRGIAKRLLAKTRELAIEKSCSFMYGDCTSHFTAMALKSLGFELHYSLNYNDYRPEGEVVFAPEPPHKAFTVYVQKL